MGLDAAVWLPYLIQAGGSTLAGAMSPNPYQKRTAYTGAAAPQATLSKVNTIIENLLPAAIGRVAQGPDIHSDLAPTSLPAVNFRQIPSSFSLSAPNPNAGLSAPWTAGGPLRKPVTAVPSMADQYAGQAPARRTGQLGGATPVIGKRRDIADAGATPTDYLPPIPGGLDARTWGALQLLQHAAGMGA